MGKQKKTNVAFLQNDFTREQQAVQDNKQRQVIFLRRRVAAIAIIAGIVFLSVGISLFRDLSRLHSLADYRQKTVAEERSVTKDVDSLQKDVGLLEDDDYVAKLARSRYFYSKEGEINFNLPDSKNNKGN